MTTSMSNEVQEVELLTSSPGDVKTLIKLRKYTGAIYAENMTFKPVSCNDVGREVSFWLGSQGKPDSIIILPPRALEVPGFSAIVQKGEVTVSNDIDRMENRMARLTGDAILEDEHRRQEMHSMLKESPTSKSVLQKQCAVSGEVVYQSAEDDKNGVVPLAPRYKHLAYQFTSKRNEEGKWEYSRIQTP